MTYNPDIDHRHSIRLKGYDYSQAGAYSVTICTLERECLFGNIVDGQMVLNDAGRMVADEWVKTEQIRHEIELDAWVIMPNHFHAIVFINGNGVCRGDRPVAPTGPQPKSLGSLMAGFKSSVTKRINELRGTPGTPLWQRNYYEHIIRNEKSLNRIRQYIHNNPVNWEMDEENPTPCRMRVDIPVFRLYSENGRG